MRRTPLLFVSSIVVMSSLACGVPQDTPGVDGGPIPPSTTDAGAGDGDGGSDASAGLGVKPSNIDPSVLDFSGVGDVILTKPEFCNIQADGTNFCNADEKLFKYVEVTQAAGSKIGVYLVRSLRVEQAANVTLRGDFPIAIVAKDKIEIVGTMVANPGNLGGFVGATSRIGHGPGGGSNHSGGSFCGLGGSGSDGKPGAAYGTDTLSPLIGGSAGGDQGGNGSGGGAVQLVAGTAVSVAGVVSMPGGGAPINSGGAGAGGAILVESPDVTISGTLAANGGGGGTGNLRGSDGLPNAQPAPGDADGKGNGSAGPTLDGAAGDKGGGGAGRIRINGRLTLSGVLSPAGGTKCTTVSPP